MFQNGIYAVNKYRPLCDVKYGEEVPRMVLQVKRPSSPLYED